MVREAFVPMLLGLFEPNGNTVSFLDGLYELIRKNGKKSKRFKIFTNFAWFQPKRES
jgi:hypothetical protein